MNIFLTKLINNPALSGQKENQWKKNETSWNDLSKKQNMWIFFLSDNRAKKTHMHQIIYKISQELYKNKILALTFHK